MKKSRGTAAAICFEAVLMIGMFALAQAQQYSILFVHFHDGQTRLGWVDLKKHIMRTCDHPPRNYPYNPPKDQPLGPGKCDQKLLTGYVLAASSQKVKVIDWNSGNAFTLRIAPGTVISNPTSLKTVDVHLGLARGANGIEVRFIKPLQPKTGTSPKPAKL